MSDNADFGSEGIITAVNGTAHVENKISICRWHAVGE